MRHGKSWQNDFETLYGPQFRAYVTALKTRLLPAFSTIDEEAERMQQATVDRLRQSANEHVDLATLPSWPAIEELGLLANCVKHAEGPSCAELRARRPDLLTDPLSLVRHCVETPLLGEGVYVALGDVEKYGAAVEAFLAELGREIAA